MSCIKSAHVITILYPKGTANIITALHCLTMSVNSFVSAVATTSDSLVDG